MKKLTIIPATALAAVLAFAGTALAHHAVLTQTVTRPCGATSVWSGTFTGTADAVRGKQWQNRYSVDTTPGNGVDNPTGAYSALVSDSTAFGPISVGPFASTVASVAVKVDSKWAASGNDLAVGPIQNSITLTRPEATTCPIATTTTVTPTTTTVAQTTHPPTTPAPEFPPDTTTVCDTSGTSASCFPPVPNLPAPTPTTGPAILCVQNQNGNWVFQGTLNPCTPPAVVSDISTVEPALPRTGSGGELLGVASIIFLAGLLLCTVRIPRRRG